VSQKLSILTLRACESGVLHVNTNEGLQIRSMTDTDPPIIAAACQRVGWGKTEAQYRRYLAEHAAGMRTCFVATVDGEFAGYVTINWQPTYSGFVDPHIPEIQDLNVLPAFRRSRIGSRLLDKAEAQVARRSSVVGIGVGLHPGYNSAQRLYVKRGYVPDGRGLTYQGRYVVEGDQVMLDDDLALYFTKSLA
jgi:GNAT superfamily N-acetyltransferase